ncbi:GGDEF domain-containing protein [Sulfobacillus thermosulfidooxidans]|uniref:GGDEF domain-containing protein n=1 Tax=Sulfobacillus thermosulfidooxidans TaxID=28034 RepID=UPI0006B5F01B|nr:GGDEF domain-containing protein [Sulfobacillus thermosulfidooxidans]
MEDRDLQFALTTLIRESRHWASVHRGLELFYRARDLLKEYYQVDSGYFVYKKTAGWGTKSEQQFRVYAPWGVLPGCEKTLQEEVDRQLLMSPNPLQHVTENWVSLAEVPLSVQKRWQTWGVQTGGSWLLYIGKDPVGLMVLRRRILRTDDGLLMSLVARQVSLVMELLRYRRAAEEVSQQDPLTGVLNRRGAMMRIETLVRVRQAHASWVFVIFDVNNFKEINDRQGHPQGDKVLKNVAKILSLGLREGDICGRWGGDEFVVLLNSCGAQAPEIVARLKNKVAETLRNVSVSAGWAIWGVDGTSLDEVYHVADRRLYQDKKTSS